MNFYNRKKELDRLDRALDKNFGMVTLIGKRRVGKTSLVREWCQRRGKKTIHLQCLPRCTPLQLQQIYLDIKDHLRVNFEPKTWNELFFLLDNHLEAEVLVLDEFPYLTQEDETFSSRFQAWFDKRTNQKLFIIILGSSQSLMEQEKNPKKVQYILCEPALRFWFEYLSVHRGRWNNYSLEKKTELIYQHASHLYEEYIAEKTKSQKYWSSQIEIDGIIVEEDTLIVQEVKFTKLGQGKIENIKKHYLLELAKIPLFNKYSKKILRIYDETFLENQSYFEFSIENG